MQWLPNFPRRRGQYIDWFLVAPRLGSLLPPTFNWVSLGLTLWCLVVIMKSFTIKVGQPG